MRRTEERSLGARSCQSQPTPDPLARFASPTHRRPTTGPPRPELRVPPHAGLPHRRALPAAIAATIAAVTLLGPAMGCTRADPHTAAPFVNARTIGEIGLSPGQFSYPRAIATDGTLLYVIDKTARLQAIDPTTGRATQVATTPEHALGMPCGLTVAPDADGNTRLYVADTHYHRVLVYDPQSLDQPIDQFGTYGEAAGEFIYPTDIAVLTDHAGRAQRIYVSEYGGADRVQVFAADHTHLASIGSFGDGRAQFNRPQAIGIAMVQGAPSLVIADACNHRVGVFDLDGEPIRWIGRAGDAPGEFNYPYGLELLPDGTALIVEFGGARLQRIDLATGDSLATLGAPGGGPGQLATPWGLARIGRELFVLDSGNNRIHALEAPRHLMDRSIAQVPR